MRVTAKILSWVTLAAFILASIGQLGATGAAVVFALLVPAALAMQWLIDHDES